MIFLAAVVFGEDLSFCLSEGFPEFKAISCESAKETKQPLFDNHGIFISLKEQGPRFNYKIGQNNRAISQYGDEVFIPFGSEAEFRSKSYSIFIKPVTNQNAFIVEKRYDLRSLGGGVKSDFIFLDASSEKIRASKASAPSPQDQTE
jgi:hypothetical protein